jgi:hypothetical protein
LTPADVLSMAAEGVVMPAQALLLACDSSNLASSAAGEWLTTAPAMLAAGSRTIVTTLFPVVDAAGDDDPVLAAAISGQDLRAAVRGLQRAGARAWDSSPNLRRGLIVDPGVDLRERRGAGCGFWLREPDREG